MLHRVCITEISLRGLFTSLSQRPQLPTVFTTRHLVTILDRSSHKQYLSGIEKENSILSLDTAVFSSTCNSSSRLLAGNPNRGNVQRPTLIVVVQQGIYIGKSPCVSPIPFFLLPDLSIHYQLSPQGNSTSPDPSRVQSLFLLTDQAFQNPTLTRR